MQVIRVISGENELSALEFQRHYRLPIPHLLDINRAFEREYNKNGWPFLMLIDRDGTVVHSASSLIEREMPIIEPHIRKMLDDRRSLYVVLRDGTYYTTATLARNNEIDKPMIIERFPCIVSHPDELLFVTFTSNRRGNNDIFLRIYDGKEWTQDIPIIATEADEFDSTLVIDQKKRIWLSWCSDMGYLSDSGRYNIFVTTVDVKGNSGEIQQVTQSHDDAMHGRMTVDRQGNLWVVYYQWHRMGKFSRDKEIYVQRFNGDTWSDEIRVSPDDVPAYEDHTDPTIAPYKDGVVIAWSWDFHQPAGYTRSAREPSIFIRSIDSGLVSGRVQHMSGRNIDTTPCVGTDASGTVWCGWDSLYYHSTQKSYRKSLSVYGTWASPGPMIAFQNLSENAKNICTPHIVSSPPGGMTIVWAECSGGDSWVLKQSELEPATRAWRSASVIVDEGSPRFPSATYDTRGILWIAYSRGGRELAIHSEKK